MLFLTLLVNILFAQDFSGEAKLPEALPCQEFHGHELCLSEGNRKNIFELDAQNLNFLIQKGSRHALVYPNTSTELYIPYETMKRFFESDSRSPLRRLIFRIGKRVSDFRSFKDMFDWLGLHDYPTVTDMKSPNYIAPAENDFPMGATLMDTPYGAPGVTVSCAACHSANLFGTKILGLTNRFPRSNEFFYLGQKAIGLIHPALFRVVTGASAEDTQMVAHDRKILPYVGLKKPIVLGLDTSLAQVGLSLARRGLDPYAEKLPETLQNPRPVSLDTVPADSKPAVWWNVKYKTRWLSDGSIVSGNPIHTNFLWNEIGRGVDLKKLEGWLDENQDTVIKELTAYVFNTEAPKYNDFFPNKISIEKARRGQELFRNNCMGCHGDYVKGWETNKKQYQNQIATLKVKYHTKTPVINVGTDPLRHDGMKAFAADLNRLQISKTIGTKVVPQDGYVPPPLVGIWARWPYFHNNSAPSLCAVLTPDTNRPKSFYMGEALNPETDFDEACNGYPLAEKTPESWKKEEFFFDTSVPGLSNQGHTTMLLKDDGSEKFSTSQKLELIEFLKTL